PEVLERTGDACLPVCADDVVTGCVGCPEHGSQQFVLALAAVERQYQGLGDGDGAVEGARVAPGFEEVRLRDVPVAQEAGLVAVKAEVSAEGSLGQRGRELEV